MNLTYQEIKESDIQDRLWFYFKSNSYRYKFFNIYIFGWESDFFCQSRAGYNIDVEIKISLSDYKNDFKKPRHRSIKNTLTGLPKGGYVVPNRFYFAIPDYLYDNIKRTLKTSIPDYAGVLVMSRNGLFCLKKAPIIHRHKTNLYNQFAKKLWRDFEHRMSKKVIKRKRSFSNG